MTDNSTAVRPLRVAMAGRRTISLAFCSRPVEIIGPDRVAGWIKRGPTGRARTTLHERETLLKSARQDPR